MRKMASAAFCLFLLCGAVPIEKAMAATTNGGQAVTQEEQSVLSAVDQFYGALNILFTGDGAPMKAAWSHAGDISYMGPDGAHLIGWDKIGPLWDNVAAAKLGGQVSAQDVHVVVGDGLALVTCVERGENVVNGTPQTVKIRSSTVFRHEDGQWKAIHHQTDLLPFM